MVDENVVFPITELEARRAEAKIAVKALEKMSGRPAAYRIFFTGPRPYGTPDRSTLKKNATGFKIGIYTTEVNTYWDRFHQCQAVGRVALSLNFYWSKK